MKTELTEREFEVLERFARQQTNAEIARDLTLSLGTVKWYAQQIYNKLGVSDRESAIARAQALGLLVETRSGELAPGTPDHVPHNLPAQFTSFLGRKAELAQIRQLLLQTRLLTITGPGGVGKTRLALQSAAEALPSFPDGVFWVGLFALSQPELIINAIAGVLRVRDAGEEPLLATTQRFLAQRRLLLVLDNYEHLLPGVALIPALLTAAPHLRILVTSREPLHVIGEQEYAIAPLELPAADQVASATSVALHPATALFVQRATAVKPDFLVTDEVAPAIVEICRRLDGLPLALELAAARCKLFAPQAMLARLDDRLTMLSHPLLDASGRRQTLRTTIDWSYELLTDHEQLLFNRLSVFAGGWTLPAADALCADLAPEQVLNGIASLIDKSLIRQEAGTDGEPRFWMLHILREYAQEQLAHSVEATEILHRHATYFLTSAEVAAPELHLTQQEQWLVRLEAEHENLRQALEWFLTHHRVAEALRLVAALGWFWVKQDHHSEGFRWVMRVLEQADGASPELRAKAILFGAGRLAYHVGQLAGIRVLLKEALEWARTAEAQDYTAWALGYLGLYHAVAASEHDRAFVLWQEAECLFRQEKPMDFGVAWVLNMMGVLYTLRGQFTESVVCFEEALSINRQIGNWWGIRLALMNLGLVAYQQGNYEQARQRFLELLPLRGQVKHRHELGNWLCGFGLVNSRSGLLEEAVIIFSGVTRLLDGYALTLGYPLNQFYEACIAQLRASLAPAHYAAAWAHGQTLGVEQLVDYVQATTADQPGREHRLKAKEAFEVRAN
jgi:predicted ATPase/DNA-binding CsgD family transcriptional regulator